MDLVCVGDIAKDVYENIGEERLGGIAYNFARNADNLGFQVALISSVNEKDFDSVVNVYLERLRKSSEKTATQKIILHKDGKREFNGFKSGALKNFKLNEDDLLYIQKSKAVFVPLTDGLEKVFEQVKNLEFNGYKVTDISIDYDKYSDDLFEKHGECFDIVFFGGNKRKISLIKKLSKNNDTLWVITLGKEGSKAFFKGKEYSQGIIKTKVVDSTGCGDSFQAAFLVEYMKSRDVKKALKAGTIQASKVIGIIGGYIV